MQSKNTAQERRDLDALKAHCILLKGGHCVFPGVKKSILGGFFLSCNYWPHSNILRRKEEGGKKISRQPESVD